METNTEDYIKNMKALGKLRRLSGIDRDTFFFGLLRTPLANREEAIVKWISLGQKRTTAEVLANVDIQNLLADVSKMP